MRSVIVLVRDKLGEESLQVPLVEGDHVVEQISPRGLDPAFRHTVHGEDVGVVGERWRPIGGLTISARGVQLSALQLASLDLASAQRLARAAKSSTTSGQS